MKVATATLLFLVTLAGPAAAQQRGSLTLGWDDCRLAGGTRCKAFACQTNESSPTLVRNLVGGYVAGANVNELIAWSGTIDIFVVNPSVPPWWQHGAAPACRGTDDLTMGFVNALGVSCFDYQSQVAGGAIGGMEYAYPSAGSNHARLRYVAAVDFSAAHPAIPIGTEVYLFNAVLRNGNTVEPNACAGCAIGALLTHSYLVIEQKNGDDFWVTYFGAQTPWGTEHPPEDAIAGWQAGAEFHECAPPTHSKNRTWGSIKSIYR